MKELKNDIAALKEWIKNPPPAEDIKLDDTNKVLLFGGLAFIGVIIYIICQY